MVKFTFHKVEAFQSPENIHNWVLSCIPKLFGEVDHIHYIFCSDSYLLELNNKALNHDYYTDILTFDLRTSENQALEAEIYISIDRVKENAKAFDCTFIHELLRVLIHGLLHLSGLNDSTDEEKVVMRKKEDIFINNF